MAAYKSTVNFSDMDNDDNCNQSDSPHKKGEDIIVKKEPECEDDIDCNEVEKNLTCMTSGECFSTVGELFLHIDQHVKFELKEEVETSPLNDNLIVKVESSDIGNDCNITRSDSLDDKGDDTNNAFNTENFIKQEPECLLDSIEIEEEQNVHTFPNDDQNLNPLTCLTCEKRFRTTNELYLHKEKHNKLELKEEDDETLPPNEFTDCQVPNNPNAKFTREQLFHDFINVSVELDGKPTYTCKLCPNEVFDRQISIRNHMQIHEKPKLKKQPCHKCDVCDASFTNSGQLSGHKKIHFEMSVQRPKCHKKFTFNKTLLVHLRTHSKDRSCTCSYCGKLFKTSVSLTSHMGVHTDDKPYKCTYCDKSFMERKRLNRHIRIHTGERPYKCSYCDATFTRNENLTYHLRSHTGEKPYECSDCGKCFTKGKALSFHQKIHTDDRPYACPHCDMRFRQRWILNTHLLTHTNERPFKCDLCDKSFRQCGGLTRHVTTIHTNNV